MEIRLGNGLTWLANHLGPGLIVLKLGDRGGLDSAKWEGGRVAEKLDVSQELAKGDWIVYKHGWEVERFR